MAIRHPASHHASAATATISAGTGTDANTPSSRNSVIITVPLMAAKNGWKLVLSQSTPGATRAPGEKVKGSSFMMPPCDL
jgi:hypothetical protein